jgi:hypothetical protein
MIGQEFLTFLLSSAGIFVLSRELQPQVDSGFENKIDPASGTKSNLKGDGRQGTHFPNFRRGYNGAVVNANQEKGREL